MARLSARNPFTEDDPERQTVRSSSKYSLKHCMIWTCYFVLFALTLSAILYWIVRIEMLDYGQDKYSGFNGFHPNTSNMWIRRHVYSTEKPPMENFTITASSPTEPSTTEPSPTADLNVSTTATTTVGYTDISKYLQPGWMKSDKWNPISREELYAVLDAVTTKPELYAEPSSYIYYEKIQSPWHCIPSKLQPEEYLEKQWHCNRCMENTSYRNGSKTYATFIENDLEFRHSCFDNCFRNYEFQFCAHHLNKAWVAGDVSLESARNCKYCNWNEVIFPYTD